MKKIYSNASITFVVILCAVVSVFYIYDSASTGSAHDQTRTNTLPNTASQENLPLLNAVSFKQWQDILASYQGKILVIDVWATWCEPCLVRFPHMVELAKHYNKQGVEFISLNVDDRDSPDDQVLAEAFLKTMQAPFSHYSINDELTTVFETLGFLSIPVVLIYDTNGQERYRLTGDNAQEMFSDKDIEIAINALL